MKKLLSTIASMLLAAGLTFGQDTLSVLFTGDMMMHAKQLEYDSRGFFSRIETLLQSADIAVANAEFSLGGKPYSGYPTFSSPESFPMNMADAGIDILLTANNHILDKGYSGLERTLGIYNQMERDNIILYTGCSLDPSDDESHNPLIITVKDITIALVNFTYGTNYQQRRDWPSVRRMERESVSKDIQKAHTSGADFIIALPHWGEEYKLEHSKSQEDWAKWLVEQGVDAIIGAHPHVVQDTARIQGVPVIYSLGNFVSNMSATNTRLELAAVLKFVKWEDGALEMLEPELHWLWCALPGRISNNYVVIEAEEYVGRKDEWAIPSDYSLMIEHLERISKETKIGRKNK